MDPCKVFLCSTEADLGPWRDAAADAIDAAGAVVVRMEDDWAGTSTPAETCRKKLFETRFVIALIGFHYGTTVPGDEEKRSFTQLEFDTAIESKMDVLPYVFPAQVLTDTGETGEKRDLQIAFRDRVLQKHTSGRMVRHEDWKDPYKVALHLVPKILYFCNPPQMRR